MKDRTRNTLMAAPPPPDSTRGAAARPAMRRRQDWRTPQLTDLDNDGVQTHPFDIPAGIRPDPWKGQTEPAERTDVVNGVTVYWDEPS